jgi:hypothetical protein
MSSQSSLRMLLEQPPERARRAIWRKAVAYTPLALAFIAVAMFAIYNAFTSNLGALVGALVFGIPGYALAYEAWSALRDLRARPTSTRGQIVRMWNKGTVLWMTRAYYLLVEVHGERPAQRFFVISAEAYLQLDDGRTVEVHHWPHTNTVISLGAVESTRGGSRTRT